VQVEGEQVTPVSHGTGFAVAPERVVTNAHVVAEVQNDPDLTIGLIPSDGGSAVYGKLVAVDGRRDRALIATTSPMHLPPLAIAGGATTDTGPVTALGYPMNVDRAQGLSLTDIFRAQPPVKSNGSLSGRRPARDFDSLLHTAPIARGSSGGPLLDDCGRVLGVNSFGTDSGAADAEFYFAVSDRELLPFLAANGVKARVNGLPCRSLADLNAQEQQAAERAQLAAQKQAAQNQARIALRKEELRRQAEFDLLAERESDLALTMVLLMAAMAAAGLAIHAHHNGLRHNAEVGFVLAGIAVIAAGVAWETQPQFKDIDDRLNDMVKSEMTAAPPAPSPAMADGAMICVVDPQRSRVTGSDTADVPLRWTKGGCVNGRTQYGLSGDGWARVFAPGNEEAVSVSRFDPQTREYRVEKYLLPRVAMARVRTARGEFQAPSCGAGDAAARNLGAQQQAVLSLLPAQPNERLVYKCSAAP
jgi:hypothetical protein